MNQMPSEVAAVVGIIDPDAYTAATYTSSWADITKFENIMAIVMAGTLGTNATVDASIKIATDASGTNAVVATGKSITQLTEAGTDSDKQAIINLRAEEVSGQVGTTATTKFTHAALVITLGTATSDLGGLVLGFAPRHGPASDNDLAAVDEIVT